MKMDTSRVSSLGRPMVRFEYLEPETSHEVFQQHAQPNGRDESPGAIVYFQGLRFWAISTSIAMMMFLTNFEVPVVTTALVAITDDLGGFDRVSWVLSSYLLGYVAVIVIFAKFSDIFGRKLVFLLSTALFIIFSAACSASQTIVQLIVFRALQGMGGGGCFSLCTILITELVPAENYTKFVSNMSLSNSVAFLLGPIVGGAIANDISWRWIFIINVPIAVPVFIIAYLAIPHDFPYHGQANRQPSSIKNLASKATLSRLDVPGTAILLFATLALTAGFEEAGGRFAWNSAYVITLLTISGILWIVLLLWERYVTKRDSVREPVLPWRFFRRRQMFGILLNFVFLGGPAVISMFIIPQRFQLVYGSSGLQAGVRLIPFTLALPVSAIFASILAGKYKIAPLYLLLAGSTLQVIGFALLGKLPSSAAIPPKMYVFEILAGWGCGINYTLLFIMIPFQNQKRDHAVGMGAGAQVRMMGSAIVLAISTSIFNSHARPQLKSLLGVSQVSYDASLLASLDPAVLIEVRHILGEAYNRQTLVLCVSAALQIVASLLMWEKKKLKV